MKLLLLLAIALVVMQSCTKMIDCQPIGSPDLPGGFVDLGGSMIGTIDGTEYGFAHVCRQREQILRLERLQGRDDSGKPEWKTLSELQIPPLRKGQALVFGQYGTCRSESGPDPSIVAIVRFRDGPEFKEVLRAWKADVHAERFQEIAAEGLVCVNEDYYMN